MRDVGKIINVDSLDSLSHEAADRIIFEGKKAIELRGRFLLALSGGRTPQPIYKLLASKEFSRKLDWSKVYIFQTDERCVPIDHIDSNFGMIKNLLLDHVSVKHCYAIYEGDKSPESAARSYENRIIEVFGLSTGEVPRFDLMLLGIGEDGHVASLFPGFENDCTSRLVVAPFLKTLNKYRISTTFNIINQSRKIMIIINGLRKISILDHIKAGSNTSYPIGRLDFISTNTIWLLKV